MRLAKPSPGQRTVFVFLGAAVLVAILALPSLAAHRNQFIRTSEKFEKASTTLPDCANGTFSASGTVTATGRARSCARDFQQQFVHGTTQLHNGDDLSLRWRVECHETDRAFRFECLGQWQVDGPNWTGGGDARLLIDATVAPYGALETTFTGNLRAA